MSSRLTRRDFFRVSTFAASAGLLAACAVPAPTAAPEPTTAPAAQPTTAPAQPPAESPTQVPATPARFTEAPMLAERVARGELPPVDERLPENPCVMPVLESIGKHGGTVRRGFSGMSDRQGPRKMYQRGFVWYNADMSMFPALAESWELSDDGSVWTWHLRPGTRWSDGEPYTSADSMWFWENVLKNATLTPGNPPDYAIGTPATLVEFEAPDDWTLIMRFPQPNPMFAYRVAWERTPFAPAHYMQQFHADFAEADDLQAQTAAAGLDSWDQLYAQMDQEDLNPDKPTLGIWNSQNPISGELHVMERNPYYWAVDAEGQQLPYVDRVQHRLFESIDVFNLWLVNGEIDFQNRHVNISNYTLLKENEANGDYQVMLGTNESHIGMNTNHTSKDARLRELFSDRRVRIAFSHAVNRDEINELVYDGLATPRQYSPMERTPQFHERLSNAYIEYDPDLANQLLDEAGYAERNADGMRLFKDGSGDLLTFTIDGLDAPGTPIEDAAQLVVQYLRDVGVQAQYQYLERSLYQERSDANEISCGWWGGDRTELPMIDAGIFLGTQTQRPWAGAWGLWRRSDGTDPNGEEPPEGHWIWDIWDTYAQVQVEPDFERRIDLFANILDIWAEELPQPCFLGMFPAPIVVKNGFRNFQGGYPIARTRCDEFLFGVETYYWEDPENHA